MGRKSEGKRIYVVFKTHFDIGFTELSEDVIRQYATRMLPDVVRTCKDTESNDQGDKFVWTMSSWPLVQSLRPDLADKSTLEEAHRLIESGQIVWHALPFTTHTEFCGLEELIRGLNISTKLTHQYGYRPISAKMTDVPGHTWILPTILSGAGIKFLHLGCNPGCMPPDVPVIFWWEGPDGSRVLTFYSKGAYGSDPVPPESWEHDVWLSMMQTNDNIGPQKPEILDSIKDTVYKRYPDAKIHFGTMDDFYYDFINSNPNLPIVKGDLADSWIHGIGTYPIETSIIRVIRKKVKNSESMNTFLTVNHKKQSDEFDKNTDVIQKIYESTLLFGEHTWGLDVKTHMGGYRHYDKNEFLKAKNSTIYKKMEKSWNEQRLRVSSANEMNNEIIHPIIQSYASKYPDNIYLVWNDTGFKDSRWIKTELDLNIRIFDKKTGELLPIRKCGNTLEFYSGVLPALGLKEYAYEIGNNNVEDYKNEDQVFINSYENEYESNISNEFYNIKADKTSGKIISLFDKKLNKEWVDKDSKESFGGYRYDIYGIEDITEFQRNYTYRFYDWLVNDLGRIGYPNCSHKTYYPQSGSVRTSIEKDRVCLEITLQCDSLSHIEYGNCESAVIKYYLYNFEDKIDIQVNLKNKQETSFVEAIHLTFPIKIELPRYRINKTGSLIDPEIDVVKDANHSIYCLDKYVDINNGKNGIMIISKDVPLFSIGSQKIYKYKQKFEKESPCLFFNVWNNQWGTNFPQWTGGDYQFNFTIFSHEEETIQGASHKAEVLSSEIVSFNGNMQKYDNKQNNAFNMNIVESDNSFEILAFKPTYFEEKTYILRIREHEGINKKVKLFFNDVKFLCECDLQERNISDPIGETSEVEILLKKFEIKTFKIKWED